MRGGSGERQRKNRRQCMYRLLRWAMPVFMLAVLACVVLLGRGLFLSLSELRLIEADNFTSNDVDGTGRSFAYAAELRRFGKHSKWLAVQTHRCEADPPMSTEEIKRVLAEDSHGFGADDINPMLLPRVWRISWKGVGENVLGTLREPIPIVLMLTSAALVLLILCTRGILRNAQAIAGICETCGYDRGALAVCPECGTTSAERDAASC